MAESGQTQLFRCKLVVLEVLTDILRDYMTHEGTAPKAIHKLVMNNKNLRHHFTSKELNVIQNLPSTGFKEFDISLMYKIAKTKLLALIIPDEPTHGWGSEPSPNEDTIGDNVMRIVNRRNELSHRKNATLLESEFKDFFEKFLDIGERAEKHLSRKDRSITSQIESDKTCCIDKDMEKKMDKLVRENEDLKMLLCIHQKQGGDAKMFVSEGTQTIIGRLQTEESFGGTSSAELRIPGIENPTEKARLVVEKKADINTDNISIKNARSGSLLIFLEIRNNLFKSDKSMEMEMKSFIDKLFDIAELKCSTYSQCNIFLHIENDIDDGEREELESYDDLVLHLEIQNSVFINNESVSQTFSQFISNVLTNMNGQHYSCKREVTAILDMTENELVSQFGQAQEAITDKEDRKDVKKNRNEGSTFRRRPNPQRELDYRIYVNDWINVGNKTRRRGNPQDTYLRKNSDMKKTTYSLMVFATIIVIIAVSSNHFYNSYLETIVVTPLDSPKINLMNSELFWGTYRSNLYFGMKTRSPKSPVIGLMWFEESLYEDAWDQNEPEIRHWCDQKHNIQKYGWLKHDGNKFGIHEVVENTFMFNTKFVKRSGGTKGGDWTARITAWPKDITEKIIVSFLVYLAVEDDAGKFERPRKIENGKSDIFGSSLDLDDFRLKFTPTLLSKKVKVSLMTGHCSNFSEIEKLVKAGLTISFWNSTHYYKSFSIDKHSPNVVVYQVTAEVPVQFDIVFRSLSFKQERRSLTGNVFTQEFEVHSKLFDERFSSVFQLEARGYDTKSIDFAKAALSNLLGEISYFHGSSLVKSKHNKKPIDYWSSSLYTSIPSRSSFPRGFLWNAGFDNILISLWNSTISEEIISSWLDLVNIEGWIPRELILGDEAKAKTPEKFIVQENDNANPPTLFLSIHNLMVRNLTNTDFLRKIFPRLKVWLNWINSSQAGNDPYTYYWRRRENNTTKLNPLTPSSGFDDYPRASHPTVDERHVDLRCWIAMSYRVLSDIAKRIHEEWQDYEATYQLLVNNKILDNLHWSPKRQMYSDYGFHKFDFTEINNIRFAATKPTLRFIDSFGYVSLFPLMLKMINPESPKLQKVLRDLVNPQLLWTDYGLRSLELQSPFYQKFNTVDDPPYWRGSIWINMNYLTLSGLNYYMKTPGKYQHVAETIYKNLRHNIVTNVIKEYYRKGYIYEHYDDQTGEGNGSHPFSGWSALIVAIMAEKYN